MVLGSEDDGAHTGALGQCDHRVGIPLRGVEREGGGGIPVAEDARKGLYLLTVSLPHGLSLPYASQFGVKSEVYEHRELVVHPLSVGFDLCPGSQRGEQEHCDDCQFSHIVCNKIIRPWAIPHLPVAWL